MRINAATSQRRVIKGAGLRWPTLSFCLFLQQASSPDTRHGCEPLPPSCERQRAGLWCNPARRKVNEAKKLWSLPRRLQRDAGTFWCSRGALAFKRWHFPMEIIVRGLPVYNNHLTTTYALFKASWQIRNWNAKRSDTDGGSTVSYFLYRPLQSTVVQTALIPCTAGLPRAAHI